MPYFTVKLDTEGYERFFQAFELGEVEIFSHEREGIFHWLLVFFHQESTTVADVMMTPGCYWCAESPHPFSQSGDPEIPPCPGTPDSQEGLSCSESLGTQNTWSSDSELEGDSEEFGDWLA